VQIAPHVVPGPEQETVRTLRVREGALEEGARDLADDGNRSQARAALRPADEDGRQSSATSTRWARRDSPQHALVATLNATRAA
jgi:hypothetical protein